MVNNRQQLDSQLKENEMVDEEFKLLKEESQIYKLVGSVLVKQERSEASSTVSKRLEYIKNEMQAKFNI